MEYLNGSSVALANPINLTCGDLKCADMECNTMNLDNITTQDITFDVPNGLIVGNNNVNISANELKWSSKDNKDHFRAYADGVFSHFEFTGDDTGGLLCDFKVPSSENPYDIRIAVGNPSGNFIQNKGLMLFQDSTGTLAGQELLIRDSAQPGGAGIALPNTTPNYVASTLNYYEKQTIPLTVSGLTGVSTVNAVIVRVGDNVGLDWGDSGPGTGQGTMITLSGIPDRFRPTGSWRHVTVPVLNNNVEIFSTARVTTLGTIDILGGPVGSVFTNAAPAAFYGSGVSYNV